MFLQKVEESPTVAALTGNDFPALIGSVGYNVGALLDRPNISMLKKVVDTQLLEMFVAVVLTDLIDSVNIDQRLNIQGHQVPIIAAQLVDQYPAESLEDFVLCFKRGATGFYGTIYNLDASVLNNWMRTYLEEKYCLIEAEHAKAKSQEADTLGKVDYKAYIERKEKERQQAVENPKVPDNWNVNGLERFKLEYFDNSEFQAKQAFQKKLHRASSDFYGGKPKGEIRIWEDANGYEILAVTVEDAEKIYDLATQKRNGSPS